MELVREETYRRTMEETVLPELASVKREGTFRSFDGADIHWYGYTAPEAARTVVIVHGFTESARKYAELIWYFLKSGSNVYICDQRGHGLSSRSVEDLTLTHVEHFEDYVADLEGFLEQVVPRDLPLRLYAHSMGGAVGALYLEKHPGVFPKAVLSSPMIAPSRGGFPLWTSKLLCRAFIAAGKARERIFLSSEYPGHEEFENSCTTSEARFDIYEDYRREHKTHQNYSPTYRWTLESLGVTAKILKKGAPERVQDQVLLCTAELDNTVLAEEQRQFIARVPHGELRSYRAKHEIFRSADDVLERYVEDVLDFLR